MYVVCIVLFKPCSNSSGATTSYQTKRREYEGTIPFNTIRRVSTHPRPATPVARFLSLREFSTRPDSGGGGGGRGEGEGAPLTAIRRLLSKWELCRLCWAYSEPLSLPFCSADALGSPEDHPEAHR